MNKVNEARKSLRLILLLVVMDLALAGCGPGLGKLRSGAPVPGTGVATSPAPGRPAGLPQPTSPIILPATLGNAAIAQNRAGRTPEPVLATVRSTTAVASFIAPGWTRFNSINQIRDLSFAPDGTLWAATTGGLVHWDPSTETYTRYLIQATAISLAPDGTLWLITEGTACHFDGATCERYTVGDGWPANPALTVEVSPEGMVWLATTQGVSRFDGSSWTSYPSKVATHDLAIAPEGDVWAATQDGIGRYVPDEDAWTTYTEEDGLPSLSAAAVGVGPHGQVWAYITWEGIYRFDGARWTGVDEPCGGLVSDIAFADDGTPWVAGGGGNHHPSDCLAYSDGEKWIEVVRERGLESVGTVALGPGGQAAVSTSLGLGLYDGAEWRLLKDGPTSDSVTSVAVTPDGAAWFGFGDSSRATPGGGLSRFDGEAWGYYLDDAEVNVLAVGPDGSLWAGVGCEVRHSDGVAWETLGECGEHLPMGNVLDIAFTLDGSVWVTTGLALARFDGQAWTTYDSLINSLTVAQDGTLWMNGWEGLQGSEYVALFDGKLWTTYKAADSFPGGFQVEAVTADGRLWGIVPGRRLASFDGGSWTDRDSWTFYEAGGGLPLDGIQGLTQAPDGTLWTSMDNGVVRIDPMQDHDGGWTVYAAKDSLPGSHLGAIAFAPDGSIWFGATRFQPADAQGKP